MSHFPQPEPKQARQPQSQGPEPVRFARPTLTLFLRPRLSIAVGESSLTVDVQPRAPGV